MMTYIYMLRLRAFVENWIWWKLESTLVIAIQFYTFVYHKNLLTHLKDFLSKWPPLCVLTRPCTVLSASVLESATVFCLVLSHDTNELEREKQKPVYDLLSDLLLPQSASTNPCKNPEPFWNFKPESLVFFKLYFNNLFAYSQWELS